MAEKKTLHLEIATPTKLFYVGEVENFIFKTTDGEMGILPGHVPIIATVATSAIRIKTETEWKEAFVSNGFIEVARDHIILLADSAEWPEEIDVNRAEQAKKRAEERLAFKLSAKDYATTQAALARALARLKIKGK